MKRLCLMALSLVLFSFSAFAWGGINNNNEVLIGGSPRVFPDEVNVGETAACLKDITLVATKTYVIKGTLDLNGKYLTASGANIILASGGSIVNTGYDQGKNNRC